MPAEARRNRDPSLPSIPPFRALWTQPLRRVLAEPFFVAARVRKFCQTNLPILAYHSIDTAGGENVETVSPDVFERQMNWLLERGFAVVTVAELVGMLGSSWRERPTVALSFDDGYLDNHTHVLPLCRRLGIRATVYVVTGFLGRTSTWNPRDYIGHRALMSSEQVCELDQAGVEIGSHGHSHRALTSLSPVAILEEARQSRMLLQELLGRPVLGLAAPFGQSNHIVAKVIAEAGYSYLVVGGRFAANAPDVDRYDLRRITIGRMDSLREFGKKVSGSYQWLARWDR